MAKQTFITIQVASDLSNKSVQTIRRAVKAKKLKHRKKRTPQGFNYLISRESLCEIYNIKLPTGSVAKEEIKSEIGDEMETTAIVKQENFKAEMNEEDEVSDEVEMNLEATEETSIETPEEVTVSIEDINSFRKALDQMVATHSEERQNFLRLINTLQEKIFTLENKISLLEEPKKKWFAFWK